MSRYQPFNDLPAGHFAALVADIERNGVLLPILVDENDKTIDGHQRRRAAAEAGVECPKVVVEGLTEDEKQTLALTLNLYRRHLSGVERTKALQQLANLGLSTRHIGNLLGLSKSQVHRNLAGVDRPDTITDSMGRQQPATKPRDVSHVGHVDGPPSNVDPATGEIMSPVGDTPSGEEDVPLATGSGAGEGVAPGQTREAPSSSSPVPVDPTLGYRATATAARSKVRDSLLTLDPERVIATTDEPDHWRQFSDDLHAWLARLDEQIAGPRLKAVQ